MPRRPALLRILDGWGPAANAANKKKAAMHDAGTREGFRK